MQLTEKGPLKRLGRKTSGLFTGGTIVYLCGAMADVNRNEVIMDFNVTGLLAAGLSSIIGQQHGDLIVLKYNICRSLQTPACSKTSTPTGQVALHHSP